MLDNWCLPVTEFEETFPKMAMEGYLTNKESNKFDMDYLWKFNEIIDGFPSISGFTNCLPIQRK